MGSRDRRAGLCIRSHIKSCNAEFVGSLGDAGKYFQNGKVFHERARAAGESNQLVVERTRYRFGIPYGFSYEGLQCWHQRCRDQRELKAQYPCNFDQARSLGIDGSAFDFRDMALGEPYLGSERALTQARAVPRSGERLKDGAELFRRIRLTLKYIAKRI